MEAINLISSVRLEARRRRRRLRAWAAACGAYGGALMLAVVIAHATWGRADHVLADQLAQLEADVAEAAAQVRQLHPELAEAQRRLEAARTVAIQPDWSVLLALVAELGGQRIVLERFAVGPADGGTGAGAGRFRLDLRGLGRDQQAVSGFVFRLEGTELFDSVKLLETSRRTIDSAEAVAFRIECALSDHGGEGGDR